MAYGLLVKNNNSEFQIDNTYKNYFFKEGGNSITITNNYTAPEWPDWPHPPITGWETTINFANAIPQIPLILFRPSTDRYVAIANYNKSGSNFSGFCAVCEMGYSTTIDWKMFLPIWAASSETYGLRTKDVAGTILFDSNWKPFNIVAVEDFSIGAPSGTQTITHSGIENPFYIIAPGNNFYFQYWWSEVAAGTRTSKIGLKKINATSISVGWLIQEEYLPDSWMAAYGYSTGKIIICQTY